MYNSVWTKVDIQVSLIHFINIHSLNRILSNFLNKVWIEVERSKALNKVSSSVIIV